MQRPAKSVAVESLALVTLLGAAISGVRGQTVHPNLSDFRVSTKPLARRTLMRGVRGER
jgi:hypothetical protein